MKDTKIYHFVRNIKYNEIHFTTLHHKSKYFIHYRNLKVTAQTLPNWLNLTKIYRIVKFKESLKSPRLKDYIELKTKLTTEVTTFEINLYSLSIDGIFGKTMENLREKSKCEVDK